MMEAYIVTWFRATQGTLNRGGTEHVHVGYIVTRWWARNKSGC